jgi:plasmid stabilization system protein ParE
MYDLILKPRAIRMQKDAYDWYEQQIANLGELFLTELEECYHDITTLPTAYSKRERDYRQVILKKFPFVVVFRIVKTKVIVYSVFHTSRNPANKLKRR